jgi:DNA (cytosine-5)-methyltransferase 3A
MIIESTNVDLAQKPSFCQTPVTGSTGLNVLSLFDGMSCGQIALQRAGIKAENYFASEIDKYAIQVAKHNYPNTKHIGSVVDVKGSDLPKIDLLIGGSPCQGFSFAGKQLNFDDPRSKLFFEFVRLKNECNPTYFLLENVKMKKEYQDVITQHLGVEPIEINSNLLSAQNRKRIYWTNIPGVSVPNDKGILLKDIVHENADNHLSEKEIDYMLRSSGKWSPSTNNRFETYLNYPERKAHCLTANLNKGVPYNCFFEILSEYIVPFDKTLQILDKEVQRGKVGYFRKDSQANRVYYIHDKAITLTGEAGGGAAKMGQYLFGCITPDRIEKRQNGQRFNDGKKFYTLTAQDKHGVLIEGYIRKLTPIECERLQTVPDNYSAIVSKSQRYKMLGNGWTVDVIAHIFGGLSQYCL